MAAIMKYEEKDIPQFQIDVCKDKCKMKGSCITDEKENHWFLMCPKYHTWKLQELIKAAKK